MAATYNFTGKRAAERAATLQRTFIWTDEDGDPVGNLTGMTGEMHVRPYAGSDELILDLDTEITPSTGGQIIILVPPATMTIGDEFATVAYVYDLFIINGSDRTRVLSGDFEVVPNVTEF